VVPRGSPAHCAAPPRLWPVQPAYHPSVLCSVSTLFHLRRDFFHSRHQVPPFRGRTQNSPHGSGLPAAAAGLVAFGRPTAPASGAGAGASRGSEGCWSIVDDGRGAEPLPAPPRTSMGPRLDPRCLRSASWRACNRRAGIWTRPRRCDERPELTCCDGRTVSPGRHGQARRSGRSGRRRWSSAVRTE
jgi:hypothetical protein